MIILDTSVASELMKPSPAPVVRDWVRARRGKELYTTSITLAEIRYGIEHLPAGRRRDLLKATADDVFAAFEDQVLPFDAAAAAHYPVRSRPSAAPTTRLWPRATARTSTTPGST
jgi:predicted nucleic acid-binding protein